MIDAGESGYVCVCNVHTVMAAQEDPRAATRRCSGSALNVPDGQPLVWAINSLGHNLAARVYGPGADGPGVRPRCPRAGHRFYLYGGRNQGALVQLALNLRQRHPGVQIVGGYSPPHRPLSAEERERSPRRSTTPARTSFGSGIGVPKQEKWMAQMRPLIDAPLLIGVGAAFDFHAGPRPAGPDVDSGGRTGVGLPARPRAAPPVAALPALQPQVHGRLRFTARVTPTHRVARCRAIPARRTGRGMQASGPDDFLSGTRGQVVGPRLRRPTPCSATCSIAAPRC